MWQRFTLDDVYIIGHYLGVLIIFSSLALLVPFVVACLFAEWSRASDYLAAAGASLILGNVLRLIKVQPGKISRRQALVVTGISWIVLASFASVPLYMSGHYGSWADAFFDGVSGLTTTGASVISDLDHLSYADNMFRFVMHYVGGLGLIVVALSIGLFGRSATSSLYNSEGRSEHVVPNVVQTTQFISAFSSVIILISTLVCSCVLFALGMEAPRAFLHALWLSCSGFMTGGFAPMADSVMYYHSVGLDTLLCVLMLMGSVNFCVYLEVWRGRVKVFFKDLETHTMIIWFLLMTAVIAASLSTSKLFSDLPAMLSRGVFMIIAAASTTGFQNVSANQLTTAFTSGAFLCLALLMTVGGSAGSTAGGIKFRRIGIIFKSMVITVKEALAADSAVVTESYYHIGRKLINSQVVKESMTVFTLFVITIVTGSLVGIAHGYEATVAIFESAAMTSNGGLTSGIVAPGMPVSLEVVYTLQMWAGRLEFVTLIALLVEFAVSVVPDAAIDRMKVLKRSI